MVKYVSLCGINPGVKPEILDRKTQMQKVTPAVRSLLVILVILKYWFEHTIYPKYKYAKTTCKLDFCTLDVSTFAKFR